MRISNKIFTWLIIIYMLTIIILSIAPINSNTQAGLNTTRVLSVRFDYLLHALLFVPWIMLIRWRWRDKRGVGFFLLVVGVGMLLAAVSEGIQYWLPYRAFNLVDLGANCFGIVLGALISGLWQKKATGQLFLERLK